MSLNPRKPIRPLADQIESVNACCLREDNLYLAEYVDGHKMVRVCRRCHHKHTTMKADAIDLYAIFSGANTIHTRQGRRHIRMGADPGRFAGG